MKSSKAALVLICGGCVVLAVLSQYWLSSRAAAREAVENWQKCIALAEQIEALKTTPAHASLEMQSKQEMTSLIEQSAKTVRISELVASIRPEAPQRVANSAYMEQRTRLEIRQATLNQITEFLSEISSRDARILPTNLRITPSRTKAGADSETWQAEVVLTYLIFSPESGRS